MASALAQSVAATPVSAASIVKAYTNNVTAGNTLYALISDWTSGGGVQPTSVSDNLNGNWTLVTSQVHPTDANWVGLYIKANTLGGAATVTATRTSTTCDWAMVIWEMSGLGTSPTQDGTPVLGNNSATTSHTSGNKTGVSSGSQLFGLLGDSGYNTSRTPSGSWSVGVSSANSTADEATMSHQGTGSGVAAGTYAATFTSGASSGSVTIIIAYQIPGGATGPFPLPRRMTKPHLLRR